MGLLCGLSFALGWAHNPSETFAEWEVQDGKVRAQLDVPWTFPEAVKAAYPEHGVGKAAFFETVKHYLGTHFFLEQNGKPIRPENIREAAMEETHGALLQMEFPVAGLVDARIHNSVMLDYNPHQRNTNRILTEEGARMEVVTTSSKATIFIASTRVPVWPWVLLGGCALGLIGVCLWLFRKPKAVHA